MISADKFFRDMYVMIEKSKQIKQKFQKFQKKKNQAKIFNFYKKIVERNMFFNQIEILMIFYTNHHVFILFFQTKFIFVFEKKFLVHPFFLIRIFSSCRIFVSV